MYPRSLGRFRCQDSLGLRDRSADELETRLREPKFDTGNARYTLSLPVGYYEGEDGGDVMHIYAVGGDGGERRELVCSVPGGSYKIENDDAGAHLYRLADGPERLPLSDTPVNLGAADHNHMAALARMNQRMRDHYGADEPTTEYITHRDLTASMSDATARAGLAEINRANQRRWRTP